MSEAADICAGVDAACAVIQPSTLFVRVGSAMSGMKHCPKLLTFVLG